MKCAGATGNELTFLSVKDMKSRINNFGFVEISDVLRFLDLICDPLPGYIDYFYIRKKSAYVYPVMTTEAIILFRCVNLHLNLTV